jgi:hypothetical protein
MINLLAILEAFFFVEFFVGDLGQLKYNDGVLSEPREISFAWWRSLIVPNDFVWCPKYFGL